MMQQPRDRHGTPIQGTTSEWASLASSPIASHSHSHSQAVVEGTFSDVGTSSEPLGEPGSQPSIDTGPAPPLGGPYNPGSSSSTSGVLGSPAQTASSIGHGASSYPDGSAYRGQFANGFREGGGVWESASGASYTGQWRANAAHGEGRHVEADGRVYVGAFREGRRHGHGRGVDPGSGSSYRGQWREDLPHGLGVWEETGGGGMWDGEWLLGVFGGGWVKQATKTKTKTKAAADRDRGQQQGEGEGEGGRIPIGAPVIGPTTGAGERRWPDGTYFQGQFVNSEMHGNPNPTAL